MSNIILSNASLRAKFVAEANACLTLAERLQKQQRVQKDNVKNTEHNRRNQRSCDVVVSA